MCASCGLPNINTLGIGQDDKLNECADLLVIAGGHVGVLLREPRVCHALSTELAPKRAPGSAARTV